MRALTLIIAVLAGANAAMAQVARVTVTDGAGSSLAGAVALVVGYDPASQATHPRFPADSAGRMQSEPPSLTLSGSPHARTSSSGSERRQVQIRPEWSCIAAL